MKKTKMFFPANVNTGNTGYLAGEINDVLETPGSVDRWLIRGCTIVVEEKKVEEKVEDLVVDEKVEVVENKTKKRKKPSKR